MAIGGVGAGERREAVVEVDPFAARTVQLGAATQPDVTVAVPVGAFPLPAAVSIGAPASTSERTFSGKRAATMAESQPPWHSPTRSTRPPRSSIATTMSAR